MKQTNIQICFDTEKLNALKQFMESKEVDLDAELNDIMQKLYEKHVPGVVRQYIEGRIEPEEVRPPKKPRSTGVRSNKKTKERTGEQPPFSAPAPTTASNFPAGE